MAVGPSGTDASTDSGDSWSAISSTGFHTVSFFHGAHGWGAGSDGRIAVWNGDQVSCAASRTCAAAAGLCCSGFQFVDAFCEALQG